MKRLHYWIFGEKSGTRAKFNRNTCQLRLFCCVFNYLRYYLQKYTIHYTTYTTYTTHNTVLYYVLFPFSAHTEQVEIVSKHFNIFLIWSLPFIFHLSNGRCKWDGKRRASACRYCLDVTLNVQNLHWKSVWKLFGRISIIDPTQISFWQARLPQ